jgi:hypothetical protein
MIRALRIVMIVWGAIGILMGLAFIFIPEQLRSMMGYETGPAYIKYFLAALGVAWVVLSTFIIIAARDPLKNISWVQAANRPRFSHLRTRGHRAYY